MAEKTILKIDLPDAAALYAVIGKYGDKGSRAPDVGLYLNTDKTTDVASELSAANIRHHVVKTDEIGRFGIPRVERGGMIELKVGKPGGVHDQRDTIEGIFEALREAAARDTAAEPVGQILAAAGSVSVETQIIEAIEKGRPARTASEGWRR
jgi:hypothetical protein